jgi:N6-L-threonylcarbamoyladenine synthase
MSAELVLAIETSCDETAVAIADSDGRPLVSRIASQVRLHAPFGGVVPELASRNHSLDLRPLLEAAMKEAGASPSEIAIVAATSGPGLASSLLVGDTLAKALAIGLSRPFYSINHMEGHLLSPFIDPPREIVPHVALIVSGGHTLLIEVLAVGRYRLLGSTKDDAAGEAFDKVGKLLGLPYPGGPEIARLAEHGRRDAFDFPRSMLHSGDFEFSFSGLKTSARYTIDRLLRGSDRRCPRRETPRRLPLTGSPPCRRERRGQLQPPSPRTDHGRGGGGGDRSDSGRSGLLHGQRRDDRLRGGNPTSRGHPPVSPRRRHRSQPATCGVFAGEICRGRGIDRDCTTARRLLG